MTYTKEVFDVDVKQLQSLLTEIEDQEEMKKEREGYLMVETGKVLENSKKRLELLSNTIQLLKIEYQEIGIRIAHNAALVSIDTEEDSYLQTRAQRDPNLENGMQEISLYGSLLYGTIFEGPHDLPVQGKCTLDDWDQYKKTVVPPEEKKIPKQNTLKFNYYI